MSKPDSVRDHNLSRDDINVISSRFAGCFQTLVLGNARWYHSEIAAGGIVAFQTHSFLLLSNSVNSEFVFNSAYE